MAVYIIYRYHNIIHIELCVIRRNPMYGARFKASNVVTCRWESWSFPVKSTFYLECPFYRSGYASSSNSTHPFCRSCDRIEARFYDSRDDSSARMRPVIVMWYKIRTGNHDEGNPLGWKVNSRGMWLIDRTSPRCSFVVFHSTSFMQMMHRCVLQIGKGCSPLKTAIYQKT